MGCLCRLRSEAKSGESDGSGDGTGVKAGSQNGTGWNFGSGADQAGSWTGNQAAGGWEGAGARDWDKTNLGEGAGSWKGATKVFSLHETGFLIQLSKRKC